MGLGGGRKRVKIGHDPNNETWARATTNYGHRLLVSQGWAPGKVLGSANSPEYSAHITDASHSHIKVSLREDNLGLGAKRGSGQEAGECVGLDAFQGLLGRLNGKSDEALEKEQQSRDDLKRSRYMEQRGTVRFVKGGTLVSDMEELIEMARQSRISMGLDDRSSNKTKESRKSKKEQRKAQADVEQSTGAEDEDATAMREKRKSKKRKAKETSDEHTEENRIEIQLDSTTSTDQEMTDKGDENEKALKAQRKADRAEKRERKQRKREEKAARKAAMASVSKTTMEPEVEKVVKETLIVEPTVQKAERVQREAVGGRHTSVRSRYIAAKRRAVMDPQALKEILMVKA